MGSLNSLKACLFNEVHRDQADQCFIFNDQNDEL